MKLTDVQRRLQAPFSTHLIRWGRFVNMDRTSVLLTARIDVRTVHDRLDAICPHDWTFELTVVEGAPTRTVKGRLTVLGVAIEDIGEGDSLKAAAADAMVRCAEHFGIGRYLHNLPRQWVDWDQEAGEPKTTPEVPEWARPDFERSPGGAHIAMAMEQLKYELPVDLDQQREVYKHLKAALHSLEVKA